MDEDDGTEWMFDEVYLPDMIEDWSRNYAEGVTVGRWYYDCRTQTVLIQLLIESDEQEGNYDATQ